MEENKICKFDIVAFLAVLILIAFIGCMCVAAVIGIKNYKISNNVAYADFVFHDNLLAHTDYNVDFSLSGTDDVQGVPYAENYFDGGGTFNVVGSSLGVVATGSSSFALGGGYGFRYDNFVVGNTYTFTVDVVAFTGSPELRYGFIGSMGFTGYGSVTLSAVGSISLPYTIPDNLVSPVTYVYLYVPQKASLSFTRVKLEEGNTFTGWTLPTEDPNYQLGYNVGYDDGYDVGYDIGFNSFFGRTNYQLIGNLGKINNSNLQDNPLLDLDFVFQNQHYTLLNSQDTPVSYYDGNTYSFYYPDGHWSVDYLPGVKVVSNLLYGNILISCPYWLGSSYWQIVFEDTITGAVVYTDYRDTLHYKFVPSYTFQTNNQATTSGNPELDSWNFFDIEYFFENPQNVYFLPSNSIHVWDLASGDIVKYPTNSFFNIYSTQSQTALTSFDDGYQKGVEAGRKGAVSENAQAVSNARAVGYEEGRRDALADGNDYTFIGLLGAVFDAPIKSFQGLLNFDVLGVNMQSFVLALLSLSVIIIIIKIALGGK